MKLLGKWGIVTAAVMMMLTAACGSRTERQQQQKLSQQRQRTRPRPPRLRLQQTKKLRSASPKLVRRAAGDSEYEVGSGLG